MVVVAVRFARTRVAFPRELALEEIETPPAGDDCALDPESVFDANKARCTVRVGVDEFEVEVGFRNGLDEYGEKSCGDEWFEFSIVSALCASLFRALMRSLEALDDDVCADRAACFGLSKKESNSSIVISSRSGELLVVSKLSAHL